MPSSSDTALLLLDLQNEMVHPDGKVGAHGLAAQVSQGKVLENAKAALAHARKSGHEIVHVRLGFRPDYKDCLSVAPRIDNLKSQNAAVIGTWGTEFHEDVAPLESEMVITKKCVSPFYNTELLTWLLRNGIKTLVLSGVATNLVVESTARAADDAGFAVRVLKDACASPNPDWHKFAIESILPVFGQVLTTAEYIDG